MNDFKIGSPGAYAKRKTYKSEDFEAYFQSEITKKVTFNRHQ
jgi:hypothetical protein